MTFDDWYKANIEPKILIPPGVTEQQAQMLRSTARRSMAACWNAGLDAMRKEIGEQLPLYQGDYAKSIRSAHFALTEE